MKPYYEGDGITLYHGDCREIDAWLTADVLVTDPPYGRAWKQGDTGSGRGWVSDKHAGISNDSDTSVRDAALTLWGARPALSFGDLMMPPPANVKHVLIYDKGNDAGFTGAVGGYRRNVEAVYLLNSGWGSGLGGRSAVLSTKASAGGNLARTTGHPHTKPGDIMERLIVYTTGVIADPFAGSGSTLVAAKLQGRAAIGVELEERYCEIAARRLSQGVLDFGDAS
jgi:hypothetical protein